MIQHDKHQYYFEKYLRNEMSYHERMAFDEKMEEDAELKAAFEFYKSHRLAMLHELIQEHKLVRRDNRLNKLIFLLISLTGIALTFNYYMHKESPQTVETGKPKERKPLYTYIPFVNWEKRAEKQEPKKEDLAKKDSTVTDRVKEDPALILEPSATDDERTATDVFLTDSFVLVHDKAYIQQLLLAKKNGMDTLLHDSAAVTAPKGKIKEKNMQLFVEFWQSPVHYKGYKFTGKKLILYGIEHPYEIYVYKEDNEIYVVHPYGETPLMQQPNFQPF